MGVQLRKVISLGATHAFSRYLNKVSKLNSVTYLNETSIFECTSKNGPQMFSKDWFTCSKCVNHFNGGLMWPSYDSLLMDLDDS